ncbi:MAG: hypothetical protein IJD89_05270 [Clostridia bacterium]|nr:hypothetical protein [Clostridia bacterium]
MKKKQENKKENRQENPAVPSRAYVEMKNEQNPEMKNNQKAENKKQK